MEVSLSTAVGLIVLTSAFDLYVQSSKTTQGQSDAVQMQLQVKSAMELMAREMQNMYWTTGSPTPPLNITTTLTAGDTISFNRIMDAGYSSGGTASTLNDTTKNWAANAYAPSATAGITYAVTITAGTGSGQVLNISGNSATQLTLSGSWAPPPDTTSLYLIYRNEGFTRLATNKLGYQRGNGGYHPIADNITQLSFNQTKDSGQSSGGNTASTLNDTTKNWAANAYAPSATPAYAVKITAGTGSGQVLNISGNSAIQLTLSGSWGTLPDATSQYVIYDPNSIAITLAGQTSKPDPRTGQYISYRLTDTVLKRN
jgi:hypothetical protein